MLTIIGAATGILMLIPRAWIPETDRFWIGCIVIFSALGVLFGREITEMIRKYMQAKEEAKFLPQSIKYEKYRRIHYVNPINGNARVVYCLTIKNIGKEKLSRIAVPVRYEKSARGRYSRKSLLVVNKISVEDKSIEDVHESFEKASEGLRKNGRRIEYGHFQIPLRSIDGLKKGDTCHISIEASANNAFPSVREEEYVGIEVYHQIDRLEFEVIPTRKDWIFKPLIKSDIFEGVQIFDLVLQSLKFDQMEKISKPKIKENTITWTIENPRLSTEYRLYFKAVKRVRHKK